MESVTLQETSPESGVFQGSIELRSSPSGILQNGILETSYGGSPYEFDTLRAVYEAPSGTFTATASTLDFRLWFIDAYGSVTSQLHPGLAGVRAPGEPQLQRSGPVRPVGRDVAHQPGRRGAVVSPGDGQDHGDLRGLHRPGRRQSAELRRRAPGGGSGRRARGPARARGSRRHPRRGSRTRGSRSSTRPASRRWSCWRTARRGCG